MSDPGCRGERPQDASRLPALDGLRAIAILLVMWHHMSPDHESNRGLISMPFKIADIGWSGVDLFFVLSGFLITGILLRVREGRLTLATFFARRLLRIVPAYFAALALVLLLVPAVTQWYPVPEFGRQWPYWTYLSNYVRESYEPIGGLFRMSHFWSLAVEMQFYLLWPLIVLKADPRISARIAVIGLVAALASRFVAVACDAHWTTTFGYLPNRMDGLLMGALIAILRDRQSITLAAIPKLLCVVIACGVTLAVLVWRDFAMSVFRDNVHQVDMVLKTIYPTLLAVFFGAIASLALVSSRFSWPLGWRGFTPLARYSYGAYIIHYVLLDTYVAWFGPALIQQATALGKDAAIYAFFALATIATFVLAFLSFHLVEQRFLRRPV